MLVKCEQPIDELTFQVWLLYHHPNFKYRTLFVSGTELRTCTDGQMDGPTDDPITRCPWRTFQAGAEKLKSVDERTIDEIVLPFHVVLIFQSLTITKVTWKTDRRTNWHRQPPDKLVPAIPQIQMNNRNVTSSSYKDSNA